MNKCNNFHRPFTRNNLPYIFPVNKSVNNSPGYSQRKLFTDLFTDLFTIFGELFTIRQKPHKTMENNKLATIEIRRTETGITVETTHWHTPPEVAEIVDTETRVMAKAVSMALWEWARKVVQHND